MRAQTDVVLYVAGSILDFVYMNVSALLIKRVSMHLHVILAGRVYGVAILRAKRKEKKSQ